MSATEDTHSGPAHNDGVGDLHGCAPPNPSASQYTTKPDNTAKSGSENGWQKILNYGKAQDEKILSEWKDELGNLLTFTGLFSAVVTGLIALTLPMLRQDSAATSVVLLAQISQQLSSLSTGPQFINSTVQSTSMSLDSFIPDPRVVRLNILWVTSLTLTLMAAFFIIAVQQWIRRVPLPSNLPDRDAVRLWHLRRDGLTTWQVPGIISWLPVFIQGSVVLFLVGLYLLLETLHHATAIVLLILGSSLLGLFLISTVLPLLDITCPYKSPIILAIVSALHLLFIGILGVYFVVDVLYQCFTLCLPTQGFALVLNRLTNIIWVRNILERIGNMIPSEIKIQLKRTSNVISTSYRLLPVRKVLLIVNEQANHHILGVVSLITASNSLWDHLELQHASQHSEQLDCHALAMIFSQPKPLWYDQYAAFQACLLDIPPHRRPMVGTLSLHRALIDRHRDASMIHPAPTSSLFVHASQHLPLQVSELEDLLLKSLPTTWSESGSAPHSSRFVREAAELVCLLYRNTVLKLAPENIPSECSIGTVAKILIAIRAQQSAAYVLTETPIERLPTVLLFGCCFRGYPLSEQELDGYIDWTTNAIILYGLYHGSSGIANWARYDWLIQLLSRGDPVTILRGMRLLSKLSARNQITRLHNPLLSGAEYPIPLSNVMLGTFATTLLGCSADSVLTAQRWPVNEEKLKAMLSGLAAFLELRTKDISAEARLFAQFPDNKYLVITSQALASIANSITRLAFHGHLAQSSECPSHDIARVLRKLRLAAAGNELFPMAVNLDRFHQYVNKMFGPAGNCTLSTQLPADGTRYINPAEMPDQLFYDEYHCLAVTGPASSASIQPADPSGLEDLYHAQDAGVDAV